MSSAYNGRLRPAEVLVNGNTHKLIRHKETLEDFTKLFPKEAVMDNLVKVYNTYSLLEFPSLREQLDKNFDQRYEEFWRIRRHDQPSLFSVLNKPVEPSEIRLNFDLDICKALGVESTKDELISVYGTLVKEMIITRGLTRD